MYSVSNHPPPPTKKQKTCLSDAVRQDGLHEGGPGQEPLSGQIGPNLALVVLAAADDVARRRNRHRVEQRRRYLQRKTKNKNRNINKYDVVVFYCTFHVSHFTLNLRHENKLDLSTPT